MANQKNSEQASPTFPMLRNPSNEMITKYNEMKDKILSFFENSQINMPKMLEYLSCSPIEKLDEDSKIIKLLIEDPVDDQGEKINSKSVEWLKKLLTAYQKTLKVRMVKEKTATTETVITVDTQLINSNKEKTTNPNDKDKSTKSKRNKKSEKQEEKNKMVQLERTKDIRSSNLLKRTSEIPASWWPWNTSTRVFKIKVLGSMNERSVDYLTEIISSTQPDYTFRIMAWKDFSVILLNQENERADLTRKLKEQNVNVEIVPWKKPQIKINYLRPPINESWEDYMNRIMTMNGFRDRNQFKVTYYYEIGLNSNKWSVIMEVSPAIRSIIEIKLNGKMSSGYNYHSVVDNFPILACRLCHKFGHTRRRCRNQLRCIKCSGQHLISACPAKESLCPTCGKRGHQAYTRDCKLYISELQLCISDYDYEYDFLMM